MTMTREPHKSSAVGLKSLRRPFSSKFCFFFSFFFWKKKATCPNRMYKQRKQEVRKIYLLYVLLFFFFKSSLLMCSMYLKHISSFWCDWLWGLPCLRTEKSHSFCVFVVVLGSTILRRYNPTQVGYLFPFHLSHLFYCPFDGFPSIIHFLSLSIFFFLFFIAFGFV